MTKKYNLLAAALLILSSSVAAVADQIDEQQKQFLSEVAVAKNTGKITAKQAALLDKELKDFSKLKRQLKEQHADVLTAEDKLQLNQTLNKSHQLLDTMINNKVPIETSKKTK